MPEPTRQAQLLALYESTYHQTLDHLTRYAADPQRTPEERHLATVARESANDIHTMIGIVNAMRVQRDQARAELALYRDMGLS